jgi:hypothetical protein
MITSNIYDFCIIDTINKSIKLSNIELPDGVNIVRNGIIALYDVRLKLNNDLKSMHSIEGHVLKEGYVFDRTLVSELSKFGQKVLKDDIVKEYKHSWLFRNKNETPVDFVKRGFYKYVDTDHFKKVIIPEGYIIEIDEINFNF